MSTISLHRRLLHDVAENLNWECSSIEVQVFHVFFSIIGYQQWLKFEGELL